MVLPGLECDAFTKHTLNKINCTMSNANIDVWVMFEGQSIKYRDMPQTTPTDAVERIATLKQGGTLCEVQRCLAD